MPPRQDSYEELSLIYREVPNSPIKKLAKALKNFSCLKFLEEESALQGNENDWMDSVKRGFSQLCSLPMDEVQIHRVICITPQTVVHEGHYQGNLVAVKIYHCVSEPEQREEFIQRKRQCKKEIMLWQGLQHPNILKLIGAGTRITKEPSSSTWIEEYALVSEYMAGGTLQQFLKSRRDKALDLLRIVALALDIARGMEYLHGEGILHRDLKSANLLMNTNGQVKVGDFGCSTTMSQPPNADVPSDVGSLSWMAPEVMVGDQFTWQADVYSYGMVLWELCSRKVPFEGESLVSLMNMVPFEDHRPSTDGFPPAVVHIMQACWAKDPSKRPPFQEVVKSMNQYAHGLNLAAYQ